MELQKVKELSSFYFDYFFIKKFNHFAKDARIFHFKLDNSHTPIYFLTSTSSEQTSRHHGWPIAIDFLHEKKRPTYYKQSMFYMERFWHLTWAKLASCRFSVSFFLFLCTFSKSPTCFINKAFQGCIKKWVKVWYPNILGSHGVHYGNISAIS